MKKKNIPAPQAEVQSAEPVVNHKLMCQVCLEVVNTLTQLHQHCSNHFIRNLQSKFGDQIGEDGKTCRICGHTAKTRPIMVMHIGCKHGKINDILVEEGYKALPCPLAQKTVRDNEIQRKLLELKRERWLALSHEVTAEENDSQTEENDSQTKENDLQSKENDYQTEENDSQTEEKNSQTEENDSQTEENDSQTEENDYQT